MVIVAILFSGRIFSSCGRANEFALDRLHNCPEARELLGDDIHVPMGWGCGSAEEGPAGSHASATIPVAGTRASGSYTYGVNIVGGTRHYSGTLEVDDQTLNMASCSR